MLEINLSTILLEMANFFILAYILHRFLFKPLQTTLKKREKETNKALDDALIAQKEADELRQRYEEKVENIDAEIAARKNEARIVIEQTRRQMLQEVHDQIQKIRTQTEETLTQLQNKAIEQHKDQIGNLVSEFSQGVLTEVMNPQLQEKYRETFLNKISEMDLSSYISSQQSYQGSPFAKVILDSQPSPEFKDRLTAVLNQQAQQELEFSFEVDPTLIAGGILRFEGELIDGSLKGQINRLKKRYLEEK